VKEQTEFLKKIMTERVNNLENKLLNYEVKFNTLNKRRSLDYQGFLSDAHGVRKRTKELEDKVRKNNMLIQDEGEAREKDDIMHDVKKLKHEIQNFQNHIRQGEME